MSAIAGLAASFPSPLFRHLWEPRGGKEKLRLAEVLQAVAGECNAYVGVTTVPTVASPLPPLSCSLGVVRIISIVLTFRQDVRLQRREQKVHRCLLLLPLGGSGVPDFPMPLNLPRNLASSERFSEVVRHACRARGREHAFSQRPTFSDSSDTLSWSPILARLQSCAPDVFELECDSSVKNTPDVLCRLQPPIQPTCTIGLYCFCLDVSCGSVSTIPEILNTTACLPPSTRTGIQRNGNRCNSTFSFAAGVYTEGVAQFCVADYFIDVCFPSLLHSFLPPPAQCLP